MWIGRNGPVIWPSRSPDFSPIAYFLWGHMKSMVYETPVESEEDLVARIAVAAGNIAEEPRLLNCVQESIQRRCQACIDAEGRHFEQLL